MGDSARLKRDRNIRVRCRVDPTGAGAASAWADRTTIVATPRSAWTWRTPSKTRNRAPPCCKWHRYGCAWRRRTMPRSIPIKVANKSLPDRSPSQASPKPGPFLPRSAAAARFLPVAPSGGIPPRSAGIGLTVPCKSNRPAAAPFRMHSAPCGGNPISREPMRTVADATVIPRRWSRCLCRRRCGQNKKPRRVAGAGPWTRSHSGRGDAAEDPSQLMRYCALSSVSAPE